MADALAGCRTCATRTMVRWRAGAARASIGSCKTKPQRQRQPQTFGRSSDRSGCRRKLREAVDAAIAHGATIDEIADLIRGEGGACSRSAVGRYTKNVRDLIRQQQETDRGIEAWVQALGERTEGRAGLILIETLRSLTPRRPGRSQRARGAPCRRQSSPAWRWFSSASRAPTSSASSGERAAAKAARAAPGAGQAQGQAPPRKGLSPETVDLIDEAVVGFRFPASAPGHIGAGRPVESFGISRIPVNPT